MVRDGWNVQAGQEGIARMELVGAVDRCSQRAMSEMLCPGRDGQVDVRQCFPWLGVRRQGSIQRPARPHVLALETINTEGTRWTGMPSSGPGTASSSCAQPLGVRVPGEPTLTDIAVAAL